MSIKKRKLQIKIPVAIERLMKDYSVYSYPVERPFFLVGAASDSMVSVADLWHPDDWYKHSKPSPILFQQEWFSESAAYAKSCGLAVVGTAHSHCYFSEDVDAPFNFSTPSEIDFKNFSSYPILGLTTVVKYPTGAFRSKFRVYPTREHMIVR
jgi:hypothetical protein